MGLRFYQPGVPQGAKTAKSTQQVRGANGLGDMKVGNLTTSQLLDPALGFGPTFQASARQGGIEALKNAVSTARPEDVEAQGAMRDYYREGLDQLGTMGDRRGTAFDTQMQRGLSNMLGQYKRSRAGSGAISSPQYDRGTGDIVSRLSEEYTKGVNDLSGQQLREAQAIGQGLQGVAGQDMQERQFQQQQAQGIANWLSGQMNTDSQREQFLAGQQGQDDNWLGSLLPAIGTIGGAIAGGPMGAAIGGAAGGGIGGMFGGGGGYSNPGMGLAQIMQQQELMNKIGSYGAGGYGTNSGGLQQQFDAMKSSGYGGPAPWYGGGGNYSVGGAYGIGR